ncbi:hypothetical protein BXY70_1924 [Roseovarius halotolerans]|uniref:Uncharacterized protein n=1 Tax=Roseovarius halotolerans TaxID=505353 RepID=A0A1X6YY78_9RHOB|nr:hypothetical protein [Roseovarius halotolerans]RKT32576.1 hypothetical protein BXY70_1924 [Roseovarius halotolerans]SLN35158.1 hypothetical protein ROH8110_01782 [Roseovarius halotolerans]
MKDRNSLLILALAVAITAGNIAIPSAMPDTDRAQTQMASKAAPDHHAPMKTAACALALTEVLAD